MSVRRTSSGSPRAVNQFFKDLRGEHLVKFNPIMTINAFKKKIYNNFKAFSMSHGQGWYGFKEGKKQLKIKNLNFSSGSF